MSLSTTLKQRVRFLQSPQSASIGPYLGGVQQHVRFLLQN